MSVAWVLNLDAELELDGRTPNATFMDGADRWRRTLRMPEGDVVLDVEPDHRALGLEGRCWCPTPRALERLRRAGALVPDSPSVDVLRRVNERGFSHALGSLPDARRCTDAPSSRAAASRPGRWLMKRGLAFAGRGQRRVEGGAFSEEDEAWLRASLTRGAVYIEPRVDITLEVSLHGWSGHTTRRGMITVTDVDRNGQWRASRLESGELVDPERTALYDTFERVSDALHEAAYFGPFGIDAFRHEGGFHPLGEINARYSMGWSVGMGGWS